MAVQVVWWRDWREPLFGCALFRSLRRKLVKTSYSGNDAYLCMSFVALLLNSSSCNLADRACRNKMVRWLYSPERRYLAGEWARCASCGNCLGIYARSWKWLGDKPGWWKCVDLRGIGGVWVSCSNHRHAESPNLGSIFSVSHKDRPMLLPFP